MTMLKSSYSTLAPKPAAEGFLRFVDASPDPFHATATAVSKLEHAGFQRLKESDSWAGDTLKRGGKYFFTRNQSSVVAFAVGKEYRPGGGISIIGAHTDSPNLRIKPISNRTKAGYLEVGVETYGGGIWHSWFDRDLSVAGRVIVEVSANKFVSKLVKVDRPILRIPTLAIHLDRGVNEAFKFNPETHLLPVLGLVSSQLNAPTDVISSMGSSQMPEKHHPALLALLADELDVGVEQIHDFELSLYDTQKAELGGIANEFIFSARQDNLMSCYTALEALTAFSSDESLAKDPSIRCIALFDNEEIGSVSTHGADGSLIPDLVRRLTTAGYGFDASQISPTAYQEAVAGSFLISSDMAHGVHPNYAEKHEELLKPAINGGPVIKTNVKQRYATTGPTTFLLRRLAKIAGVPLQEFSVRNDSPCGSTIGPMLSAKLGIRTIDIGNPQLSMHSIRETCGSDDPELAIKLYKTFFERFSEIDKELTVDA